MSEPWFLPGLTDSDDWDGASWYEGVAGGRPFRTPRLEARAADGVASRVRSAALRARRERSLGDLVKCLSEAACRLIDTSHPLGKEALQLLQEELGWGRKMARETLHSFGAQWSKEALWQVIRDELPDPAMLEDFRAAPGADTPGRMRRAVGPPLLFLVSAANVPGVAITAALRALIARSGLLARTPQAEPGLLPLFFRGLAQQDPLLGDSVAATWWPSAGDAPLWQAWTARAGKVVVYGGEDAAHTLRDRTPAHIDLVVYGPRVGLGVVLSDAALPDPVREDGLESPAGAAGLARDVCAYEQQGCVSPRVVYVIGDPLPFAERLAKALAAETKRLPPPDSDAGTATAIRSARSELEFRGYARGEAVSVLGSTDDLSWTVLVHEEPTAETETLPRVVSVCGLSSVEELAEPLRLLEGRIQSIGFCGRHDLETLADLAATLGVSPGLPYPPESRNRI
jgi:hypothetical protein